MPKTPKARTQADIIDDFRTAAWQDEVDLLNALAAQHPWLVDPAQPHLVDALSTACNSCQPEAAKLLVEKYHADMNKLVDGMSALHEALNSHDLRIVRMLVKNGADVNLPTQTVEGFVDGWTPLHFAVSSGDEDIVRLFIEHGANPRAKEKNGLTVAEFARSENRPGMATLVEKLTPPATEGQALWRKKPAGPRT